MAPVKGSLFIFFFLSWIISFNEPQSLFKFELLLILNFLLWHYQKDYNYSQADLNNHSDQLNPNNDEYQGED